MQNAESRIQNEMRSSVQTFRTPHSALRILHSAFCLLPSAFCILSWPHLIRSLRGVFDTAMLDVDRGGLYDSPWPAEDGGPQRRAIAPGRGLRIRAGEQLVATTRSVL